MPISRIKNFFIPLIVLLTTISAHQPVYAVIDLEVMPTDGTNSLHFGNIDSPDRVNAEVRIRITANEDKQYQIFQRLQEPFVNDRGEQLNRDVVRVSSIVGSNSSGTLYVQDVERLGFGDQLIYTSNPSGVSDAFTLIYEIDKEMIRESGNFFGKIIYTLRPVDGGTEEQVVLNAFLESYQDEFTIDVRSTRGGDRIALKSDSEFDMEGSIEISFSGHAGRSLRIYQELDQYPANEEGQLLKQETMTFAIETAEGANTEYSQPQELKSRRVLLYESEAREDTLVLTYRLSEKMLAQQLAGNFKGAFNIIVEGDTFNEAYPFELEVDVAPVFELSATYPDGGVSFKELLPDSPAQVKEVIVDVHTNIGKPYEVVQNVNAPMTNEEGEMIESEHFTLKTELSPGAVGRIRVDDFTPVQEGDTAIFTSDNAGSPSQFRVQYRLKPYMKMPAGRYRTSVVFSLNEV